jgi:hypothetical protein
MAVEESIPMTYQLRDPFRKDASGTLFFEQLLHRVLHMFVRPESIAF